jgi:hypothetical protein
MAAGTGSHEPLESTVGVRLCRVLRGSATGLLSSVRRTPSSDCLLLSPVAAGVALEAPLHFAAQDPPDVAPVVVFAGDGLHHLGYPRQGPGPCVEPVSRRSLPELAVQTPELRPREPGLAPRAARLPQRIDAASGPGLKPAMHADGADAEPPSDLALLQTRGKQSRGAQAAGFEVVVVTASRRRDGPIARGDVLNEGPAQGRHLQDGNPAPLHVQVARFVSGAPCPGHRADGLGRGQGSAYRRKRPGRRKRTEPLVGRAEVQPATAL